MQKRSIKVIKISKTNSSLVTLNPSLAWPVFLLFFGQDLEGTAKNRPEDFRGWRRMAVGERRAFFESKVEDRARVRPTTANPQARK